MNVDTVVRALATRGPIEEVRESVSGARLYGATHKSLEKVSFASLDELTPLAPYLPTGEGLDELKELLRGKMCTSKAESACKRPSPGLELSRVVPLKH